MNEISIVPSSRARTLRIPDRRVCFQIERIQLQGEQSALFKVAGASHIFQNYKDVSRKAASFDVASPVKSVRLVLSLAEGRNGSGSYVRAILNFETNPPAKLWPQAIAKPGDYAEYIFFANDTGRSVESHLIIRCESLIAEPSVADSSASLQAFSIVGPANSGSGAFGTRTIDPELMRLL